MARPTLTTLHNELCSAMATALSLSTVTKLHPSWGRPEGAVPMAAIGWQDADMDSATIGSAFRPAQWRLSYYGANERQLLAAVDGLLSWLNDSGHGWSVGGHPVEVTASSIARQTPESGLAVEANAFDATLITTY